MSSDKSCVKSDIGDRGCLPNIAKCYILIFNLIVLTFGVLITGLGIILIIYRPIEIYYSCFACILTGCILVLISNIALRAISRESITLLIIYLGILVIPAILKIILFFLHRDYDLFMLSYFKYQFDRYGMDGMATETVDVVQKVLGCCGFNGPESMDFKNGTYTLSCCRKLTGICESPFPRKCSLELERTVAMMDRELSAVLVFICCMQTLCIIATIYLICYLIRYKSRKHVTPYSNF